MCGIAGLWSVDESAGWRRSANALQASIAHRGPDGQGVLGIGEDGSVRRVDTVEALPQGSWMGVLLHRRLSIVDVEGGAQPMSNEDGRIWLIFNGEIYNHASIRAELIGLGHHFATKADTEVIVHGWEHWGPGLLERLNGIYAFALLDLRTGRDLWLARDPAGVKPLYLGVNGHTWWFASELAAARQSALAGTEIDPAGLAEYLVYRFVPSPRTVFKHAWKVPPGHYCRIDERSPAVPEFRPFRYARSGTSAPRSTAEWGDAIGSGLRDAVRRQLMSDVPVGSLLSGGVDSTIVTQSGVLMIKKTGIFLQLSKPRYKNTAAIIRYI